jgi:hypothetical protein
MLPYIKKRELGVTIKDIRSSQFEIKGVEFEVDKVEAKIEFFKEKIDRKKYAWIDIESI